MKPYYSDDFVTLYHGDCREILPALDPASVDLVMTDPPFSVPVKYQDTKGEHPRSWGDLMVMEPFFQDVFAKIRRVVRGGGRPTSAATATPTPCSTRPPIRCGRSRTCSSGTSRAVGAGEAGCTPTN